MQLPVKSKGKLSELKKIVERYCKSTFAKPVCKVISSADNATEQMLDALRLTVALACCMQEVNKKEQKLCNPVFEAILEGQFDNIPIPLDHDIERLIGLNTEGLKDHNKRPMSFLDNPQFATNFHSHTGKLRDTDAPGMPGIAELTQPPPMGVTSRSYPHLTIHHARNNLGVSLNALINQYILIDDAKYRLQGLLSFQDHSENIKSVANLTRKALELDAAPDYLKIFAKKLKPRFDQKNAIKEFGNIENLSQNFRQITLKTNETYINLSPVASVEMLEDHLNVISSGGYAGFTDRVALSVGDGNPINVGSYASNRAGIITLLEQPCPNKHEKILKADEKISKITKNGSIITTYQRKKWAKQKNDFESPMKFKERLVKGLKSTVKQYKKYLSETANSLKKELDHEDSPITTEFLEKLFPEKHQPLLNIIIHGKLRGVEVDYLAPIIFWDLYETQFDNFENEVVIQNIEYIKALIRELF